MTAPGNPLPRPGGAVSVAHVNLAPATLADLRAALVGAEARGESVVAADLRALHRVLAHVPEDMTVTVEAGITLAGLQAELARRGQWLPLDPPRANTLTIARLLDESASGPRRHGCGTARDHLIGLKVVLADGHVVASGGKVVKNVAGYDLHKLFIGARGTLGVIVEATFKLRPLPEAEEFVAARCESPAAAEKLLQAVLASPLAPVVLDLHNLPTSISHLLIVLGFAGSHAEVDWQLGEARKLGFNEPTTLDYETEFWAGAEKPHCLSVLPSRVCETLVNLDGAPFVARAGCGLIWHRGAVPKKRALPNARLLRRVKDAFDPKNIFPELTP